MKIIILISFTSGPDFKSNDSRKPRHPSQDAGLATQTPLSLSVLQNGELANIAKFVISIFPQLLWGHPHQLG